MQPIIQMVGITKQFGGVRALDHVDFEVLPGEVHALVGDNGAGKSTLIKILCGVYTPDAGQIFVNGQAVKFNNPRDSQRMGIQVIYQDLALVEDFDATTNLFLGKELFARIGKTRLPIINQQTMRQIAIEIFNRVRIKVPNVNQRVFYMSGGQRQGVAIGRAINSNNPIHLLIMDEPTAALGVEETGKVLDLIRALKSQGVTILIISHNLEDVFAVADRITALKTGRRTATVKVEETTKEEVVSYIVGAKTQVPQAQSSSSDSSS